MKSAVLTGLRQLRIREEPKPILRHPEDVLIRIDTVGVCGSDVHYYTTGRIGSQVVQYPYSVGHECAGTILEIGAKVKHLKIGDRVAVEPAMSCGSCDQCLQGRHHTCRKLRFLGCPGQADGSLKEYFLMPAECCFPIPNSMTLVQATLVEPLSIGIYAQRLAQIYSGAKIAILGAGPIGLSVLLAVRAETESCTNYVTDLIDARLEVAKKCGADWTGVPTRQDIVADILQREPLALDFVFECAGQQETIDQGIKLLKPGGTLLLIGIPEINRISFDIDTLRRREIKIQNVRRQNGCVKTAIDLIADGKINADQMVTHHFSMDETQKAFDLVADYRDGVVKALIHVAPQSMEQK
ncbi:MAG: NAD(P)-dependent alcohol dehydrogenase [Phycisphaerae bacterium]